MHEYVMKIIPFTLVFIRYYSWTFVQIQFVLMDSCPFELIR